MLVALTEFQMRFYYSAECGKRTDLVVCEQTGFVVKGIDSADHDIVFTQDGHLSNEPDDWFIAQQHTGLEAVVF